MAALIARRERERQERAAAIARREMEEEQHGPNYDGLAEILEDYADSAEFELYGPVGLREG